MWGFFRRLFGKLEQSGVTEVDGQVSGPTGVLEAPLVDRERQTGEVHQGMLHHVRALDIDAAWERLYGNFLANRREGTGTDTVNSEMDSLLIELQSLLSRDVDPVRQEALCRRVLELEDAAHTLGQLRLAVLSTRGIALRALAKRPSEVASRQALEESVACFDAALEGYTWMAEPGEHAAIQNNKGATLIQIASTSAGAERRRALEESVECFDWALGGYTRHVAPLEWAATQNYKGDALRQLAGMLEGEQRRRALQASMECFDAALLEYTREVAPREWAATQNNRGATLREVAELLRGVELFGGAQLIGRAERRRALEESVACFYAALQEYMLEVAPREWAATQNNRGATLIQLASASAGEERRWALKESVACFDAALLVYTRELAPLEWAATQNYKGDALRELAGTLEGEERRWALENSIACYDASLSQYPLVIVPGAHRRAAGVLASARLRLALQLEPDDRGDELVRAWEAVASGIAATQALERLAPSLTFRQDEWAESASLYSLAATIQALRGVLEEAALLLEGGRARGLAEVQGRRRADLNVLTPSERERYVAAVQEVVEIEARGRQVGGLEGSLELAGEARHRNDRLAAVFAELHAAHPAFLPARDINIQTLAAGLRQDEALVYLSPQATGTLIMLLPRDGGVRSDWLDDLTSDDVFRLAVQPDGEGRNRLGYLPAVIGWGPTPLDQALDELLPRLGDKLMRKVVALARSAGTRRAVLVSGGFLATLPLHAASYTPLAPRDVPTAPSGRRYACDDLAFTYAPSGRAYGEARAAADRLGRPTRGFVVGNPKLTRHGESWGPDKPGYLPYAVKEAESVADIMRQAGFAMVSVNRDEAATWNAVVEGLQHADVAHLSMHAMFDSEDPLHSALLVAPGARLFLRDLLDPKYIDLTCLRLAVVSACQSGLGDFQRLSEEAVGLFGGLLVAGSTGVVGSLWSVYDMSTAVLMEAFQRRYLLDGMEPDEALSAAQRELRGLPGTSERVTTPSPLADYDVQVAAEQIAQAAAGSAGASGGETSPPAPALTEVRQRWSEWRSEQPSAQDMRQLDLSWLGLADDEQDGQLIEAAFRQKLEHPIHWAAFVYYGA